VMMGNPPLERAAPRSKSTWPPTPDTIFVPTESKEEILRI
jgi:hypothetical protein